MQTNYFIAVPLPAFVKEALAEWREHAESVLPFQSWVHQDDYHITLAFLGSADAVLSSLQKEMERMTHPGFSLSLKGLQTFGVPERPRILWADVTHPSELSALQSNVHDMCEALGFSLEKRPYRPHITLARRWRSDRSFDEPSELWKPISFSVQSIVLYKTHVERVPKYEEIYKVPLL
ncbi:RNA 2',3'-cyclic phosphodiesterase [Ectobacillus panaciterrae]|uniref:RNA 2',3'-cyclic phosphodiesterase n=1 Tax=Ectobacillus panaciterrae TaxID=363872 RepID=UPI000426B27D|nr:RNA 2',3'-cyclic phosphodiesterase [Ectobacillus panaciterrae]